MSSFLEVTAQSPDRIIYDTLKKVIDDIAATDWKELQYEGEYPVTGFGIQELRPGHLGTTLGSNTYAWRTTVAAGLTAYTWNDWFGTITINQDSYIVITGFINLSPNPTITEIKITANGNELPVMHIEYMYGLQEARIWLKKPIVLKPKSTIKIELWTTAAQQNLFGLMGFTIGKRSYLINKAATSS